MYRYSDGQISLTDFEQPMGMKLREDNRWVKKAQIIPWGKIEDRYAALFPSNTGNVAKPLRLALGALFIQQEYGYSDEEIVLQIQENPYLQYFCGYSGFDDSKPPFDSSSMVHFRKRITPEILGEINEMIIQEAQQDSDDDNDNDNDNLSYIDAMLEQGKTLKVREMQRLETICHIYEQQKYMYDNHTHTVPDRIVSVSQPFVRPIVRGKAGKPVEFGMKLDISVVDGWTRLEYHSFDAYNEATKLQDMIEAFRVREGHYPSRVLADKIYRNRENLRYCKERGIRLSGPALGRPKKGEVRNKAQDYKDECERVEVERRFSLSKRKCGMGLVTAKLQETAEHVIAMSILVLNLRRAVAALLRLFCWLMGLATRSDLQNEKLLLIQ